jgi:hypothetical protein
MHSTSLLVAQTFAAAFLAVLFLQSGLDKVFDWKGNKDYIAGFFAKTPLRRFSTMLLFQITVLEVFAGVFSAAGAVAVFLARDASIGFVGAVLSTLNFLALFFGQRIARDYAAAAGMMPYAAFGIGAVLLLGAR